MDREIVSIICPCYNSENTIADTIQSIISQSYIHWELIVVDDCSTDQSLNVVNTYQKKDYRVKCFPLSKNCGPAKARNYGISKAKGRYIAFIDSDDLWHPQKLFIQMAFIKQENRKFVFTAYQWMDEKGNLLNKRVKALKTVDKTTILKGNKINSSTVLIDNTGFKSIYFKDIKHEDYDLWIRLIFCGKEAHGINDVLSYYRIRKNSRSNNKWLSAKWTWEIYRKHVGLSFLKSCYFFICYSIQGLKRRVF